MTRYICIGNKLLLKKDFYKSKHYLKSLDNPNCQNS